MWLFCLILVCFVEWVAVIFLLSIIYNSRGTKMFTTPIFQANCSGGFWLFTKGSGTMIKFSIKDLTILILSIIIYLLIKG